MQSNPAQRYCTPACAFVVRQSVRSELYTADHRADRQAWAPHVASGSVRCARGAHCFERELVDGVFVGGYITGEWDLGHADGESVGGPEHRRCNRATAGGLRKGGAERGTETPDQQEGVSEAPVVPDGPIVRYSRAW